MFKHCRTCGMEDDTDFLKKCHKCSNYFCDVHHCGDYQCWSCVAEDMIDDKKRLDKELQVSNRILAMEGIIV